MGQTEIERLSKSCACCRFMAINGKCRNQNSKMSRKILEPEEWERNSCEYHQPEPATWKELETTMEPGPRGIPEGIPTTYSYYFVQSFTQGWRDATDRFRKFAGCHNIPPIRLKEGERKRQMNGKHSRIPEEVREFIQENAKEYGATLMARMVLQKYQVVFSKAQMKKYYQNNGLRCERKGRRPEGE